MKKKKKSSKRNKSTPTLLILGMFLLGFLIGLLLFNTLFPNKISPSLLLRESGYQYINPLIDFDNIDFIKTKEARNLERQLNNYVRAETEKNHDISKISIYYRDLNTGVWVGINEKEQFALASLTKVPVMIAHYKIAESNPEHLTQKFTYSTDSEDFLSYMEGIEDNRIEGYTLKEDKEYTLDDFISQVIKYSDNTMLPFLVTDEYYDQIIKTYSDLGVNNPYTSEDENVVTVREYSSFFRILYNSTYLSKEMSSKALELLSQVSFDDGLAKGIPEDVVLANKFGERRYQTENGNIEQLHDCGIIYHRTKPYILCIMTRGAKLDSLRRAIVNISSIVYKIVDTN